MRHARPDGPDRLLPWKIGLLCIGAALLFAAIATERDWLAGLAVAALALGLGLRLLGHRDGDA